MRRGYHARRNCKSSSRTSGFRRTEMQTRPCAASPNASWSTPRLFRRRPRHVLPSCLAWATGRRAAGRCRTLPAPANSCASAKGSTCARTGGAGTTAGPVRGLSAQAGKPPLGRADANRRRRTSEAQRGPGPSAGFFRLAVLRVGIGRNHCTPPGKASQVSTPASHSMSALELAPAICLLPGQDIILLHPVGGGVRHDERGELDPSLTRVQPPQRLLPMRHDSLGKLPGPGDRLPPVFGLLTGVRLRPPEMKAHELRETQRRTPAGGSRNVVVLHAEGFDLPRSSWRTGRPRLGRPHVRRSPSSCCS